MAIGDAVVIHLPEPTHVILAYDDGHVDVVNPEPRTTPFHIAAKVERGGNLIGGAVMTGGEKIIDLNFHHRPRAVWPKDTVSIEVSVS